MDTKDKKAKKLRLTKAQKADLVKMKELSDVMAFIAGWFHQMAETGAVDAEKENPYTLTVMCDIPLPLLLTTLVLPVFDIDKFLMSKPKPGEPPADKLVEAYKLVNDLVKQAPDIEENAIRILEKMDLSYMNFEIPLRDRMRFTAEVCKNTWGCMKYILEKQKERGDFPYKREGQVDDFRFRFTIRDMYCVFGAMSPIEKTNPEFKLIYEESAHPAYRKQIKQKVGLAN